MKATAMTVKEIQAALRNSGKWDVRSCVMVPNVSWGLLWHEADFVSCSPAGRLTEVEIKRSWSDYKADFAKNHHHEDPKVTYFYYCVPESLVEKIASATERVLLKYQGIDLSKDSYKELNNALNDWHKECDAITEKTERLIMLK